MAPQNIEPLLKEYLAPARGDVAILHPNPEVDAINARLEGHYQDSFQVRLKKVYEVEVRHKNQPPVRKRVLAKSVGWGWLGYHAYVAGTRLQRWVPEVLGLRNGFLFTAWEEGGPWSPSEVERESPEVLSSYIVDRTMQLRLPEDPRFEPPETGWGWLEIARILRNAYGNKLGYLKQKSLIDGLRWTVGPFPSLIDGRMRPDEWIRSDQRAVKLDFEHHNFGAPEFDVVDPAYDLAGTAFEFQFSPEQRERMLQHYIAKTGDTAVQDRMVLYELMYGTLAQRFARERILRNHPIDDRESLNQRHSRAWSYLVFAMARFTSGLMTKRERPEPNGVLVSMDLDGVLDSEVLGFPHGTPSGLSALATLHFHGFTVIPNTGRNIEHVRTYCRLYGFPAGVAEYGSVIFDAREGRELPLIDAEVSDQLLRCRDGLRTLPGVFLDSGYRYSVRAYRYNKTGTEGLSAVEAKDFLRAHHLDRLTVITRGVDSYFVGATASKGAALGHLRDLFSPSRTVAIGDSNEDLPMLDIADEAFAPGNCSAGILAAARRKRIHVVSQTRQRGLLKIARVLSEGKLHPAPEDLLDPGAEHSVRHLLYSLLSIAEQSRLQRVLALFDQGRP